MASVHCRECGAQMSTQGWRCMKCGARPSSARFAIAVFVVLTVIVLFKLLGSLGAQ